MVLMMFIKIFGTSYDQNKSKTNAFSRLLNLLDARDAVESPFNHQ